MSNAQHASLTLQDYGWTDRLAGAAEEPAMLGKWAVRVLSVHRDAVDVGGPDFAGRIPITAPAHDDARITTGDWLALDPATRKVVAIFPRASLFQRRNAGTTARIQSIAANVDTVFIVTSANADFNVPRLERYLALAHEAQVPPVILITKADLVPDVSAFIDAVRTIRHDLPVETINARDSSELAKLKSWLAPGQTIALLGSSGVGKSTLINSLMGLERQATQGIREGDAKGRHTTSSRSLHRLPSGAWLMDTPGMRELQIVDAALGIEAVFDDVTDLVALCRFSDCTHQAEPGCAVRAAIDAGTLDPDRLERYRKLHQEDRRNTKASQQAQARDKRTGKLAREANADKAKRRQE